VPEISHDPRWTVAEVGPDPARHRVTESLFTLTSGGVGLRGSVEETTGIGHPLVVADGVYRGPGVDDGLLPGPDLVDVRLTPPVGDDVRVLDLRTGVLERREVTADRVPLRSLRFGSIVEPGVLAMRVEAVRGRLHHPLPDARASWSVATGEDGGIGAVVRQDRSRDGDVSTLERVAAVDWRARGVPSPTRARARLDRATRAGFDALLARQRAAWSRRWERVDVRIPDDPATELGLRLALFHLWGLVAGDPEVAVGARALTGSGYAGHVFWDADVFVLPAMVSIDPPTADAMVRYRLARLDAARAGARAAGRHGARYPWESALTGQDVTPSSGWVGGDRVPILTGRREEHITADVAWAVVRNAAWSRPGGRLRPAERTLLAAQLGRL
jgi:trehalose/maltose hydrolase-like predicted phosphorylase